MPTAPQYVATDFQHAFFNPGSGLPIISQSGIYIADQPTLDAVFLSAGNSGIVLLSSNAPFGSSPPSTPYNLTPAYRRLVTVDEFLSSGVQVICGHRGGLNIFPEETISCGWKAVGMGVNYLDFDSCVSADGVPYALHDTTLDRVTNGTGGLSAFTAQQIQNIRNDPGNYLGAGWTQSYPLESIEDILDAFGGKVIFQIEPKTDADLPLLIAAIVRRGLQRSVLLATSFVSQIPTIKAAGIGFSFAFEGADQSPMAAAIAAGPPKLWITAGSLTGGTGATPAQAAALVATGIPVMLLTSYQSEWATYQALGCKMLASDDFLYTQNRHAKRTTDSWISKIPGHGTLWTGSLVRPVFAGVDQLEMGNKPFAFLALAGEVSPSDSSTKQYDIDVQTVTPSLTAGDDYRIGVFDTDAMYAASSPTLSTPANGYVGRLTQSGQMFLYRVNAGVPAAQAAGTITQIGTPVTTGVTAAVAGQTDHLRLQVTAGAVTFTDTTTGKSVTAPDLTFRPPGGWYFWHGKVGFDGSALYRVRGLALS